MQIVKFIFNPLQENTYLVWDESGECAVIDAGNSSARETEVLANFIAEQGLKPVLAVNTHCHFDHIFGVQALKTAYGVKFAASTKDEAILRQGTEHAAMFGIDDFSTPEIDVNLDSTDEIRFGETVLKVIKTPGHTPGGVVLHHKPSCSLFTGDTLFRECIGRTDLFGGDYTALMHSIIGNILPLGDDTTVYPGHGEKSDLGHESLYNPFIVEVINEEVNYK